MNLEKPCPFWDDSHGTCALRDCGVESCSEDEEKRLAMCEASKEIQGELGNVTAIDTAKLLSAAPAWDLTVSSWTDDGVSGSGARSPQLTDASEWIDLADNPEQYTGYSAAAGASRIWQELHIHNSFHSPGCCGAEERPADLERMPVEQRLFYRMLSGMHASVSSHIAANYLVDKRTGVWGLELDEYQRRLGDHPERLHHLHFAYLSVLRALELASDFLSTGFKYSTGMPREDAAVAREVRLLLASQPEWPLTFDEHAAFAGVRCPSGLEEDSNLGSCAAHEVEERAAMLQAFRLKLNNISRLMNCVGCGRCRLWGTLQIQGLGTALRILYAPNRSAVLASLSRHDLVSLFHLLGRLSHSVEVARVVVPLLGAAHSTCSPRGCKATEYQVEDDDIEPADNEATHTDANPFATFTGGF
eukprot:CAMPEP_0172906612 /NCGR_PEP_ID=MMETSP1075-20121228/177212_1 /TAXON_ID=2916 /ORGANISM="Ceratium fusus, Strain PA161109" /LENGTH=416 /DNA_ID=CAMNT_0013764083 /DNA_START=365 /DNA_END=1615 /DNA_ORIENTATION=-